MYSAVKREKVEVKENKVTKKSGMRGRGREEGEQTMLKTFDKNKARLNNKLKRSRKISEKLNGRIISK